MDWIEEVVDKYKIKVKHLSLKKALILYIFVAIITVIFSYFVTVKICESWMDLIVEKYTKQIQWINVDETIKEDKDINNEAERTKDYGISENISNSSRMKSNYIDYSNISKVDRYLLKTIEFIQVWSMLIYSLLAIILTSKMFYKHKLAEPLSLLKEEANYISRNDLGFDCTYNCKDEMGELCSVFNNMRLQLIENQRSMWHLMEEQRRLNAAFAHDLRTPLTVLYGYTDLLIKYIPEGKVDSNRIMEYLILMQEQISRLHNFSDTMKEINQLDELELRKKDITMNELTKRIQNIVDIIKEDSKYHMDFTVIGEKDTQLIIDDRVILEVLENLLSNALRYASNKIEIVLEKEIESKKLFLYVKDDGIGFTKEDIRLADKPYYSKESKKSKEHFGIGLTICKILSEKHGGELCFSNSMEGGAIVLVSFYCD